MMIDYEKVERLLYEYIDPFEVPGALMAEKKGKWIGHIIGRNGEHSIDKDTCSECGSRFYQLAETGQHWRYCPNCGAKMEADDE